MSMTGRRDRVGPRDAAASVDSPEPRPDSGRSGRTPLRSLARALTPVVVVLLALAHLSARGDAYVEIVARMLPTPLGAIDPAALGWVRGVTERARVFEITLDAGAPLPPRHEPATGAGTPHEGTRGSRSAMAAGVRRPSAARGDAPAPARRVRLRLDSGGTTRLLFLLDNDGDGSRLHALGEWLGGRARFMVARDRDWIDVGALPGSDGAPSPTRTRIVGLLPTPFAFARANAAAAAGSPALAAVGVRVQGAAELPAATRGDSPGAAKTRSSDPVLHEIVERAPVPLGETLQRIFFFSATGRLLAPALGAAVLAFVLGWIWLGQPQRRSAGAGLLVASTVVLHATLLPPLQAADETSHAGAIEVLVASGFERHPGRYPRSIVHTARALAQDRVQHHPREILPLAGEPARSHLAATLRRPMRHQIDQAETPPAGASVLDSTLRAPAYYEPFRLLGGLARKLAILDRLTLYRLLSTTTGLLLAGAGLFWLRRSGCDETLQLGYCLILLWPHAVIVLASTSNYAPALGTGALAGAAAVAAVVADDATRRRRSRWLAVGSLLLGTLFWLDFGFGAGLVALLFYLMDTRGQGGTAHTVALGRGRTVATGALAALGLTGLAATLAAGNPEAMARLGRALHEPQSLVYGVVALPLVLGLVLARWARRTPPGDRLSVTWRARRLSLVLVCATLAGFVLVPRTTIPYETRLLPVAELFVTWLQTSISTALAWDQDTLSWKLLVGAAGWHDVPYPDVLHALLRWASVALLLALPILSVRRRVERPDEAARLLVLAGAAVSLAALTLALRHGALVHPQGRFVMPWLVLIVLPLLACIDPVISKGSLVPLLRAGALLQIFLSLAFVGGRYALGA